MRREPCHIETDFTKDRLGHDGIDPRNGIDTRDGFMKRGKRLA